MKTILVLFLVFLKIPSEACQEWFKDLKISNQKNCESACRVAPVDMSTFGCHDKCKSLCAKSRASEEDKNFYGLTDDEINFCKQNKVDCLKAYQESWNAEKICLSIYPVSDVNDESDACRHYVWSILLSQSIGEKNAEIVLNAHENNPKEEKEERAMDLANNRLGLLSYQKMDKKLISDEFIKDSFKQQLKENKLIILKPFYKSSGGLP